MTMVAMADHFAPLMVFSRKLILVRRFVHEAFENGQKNNLDIEPEAPLADVLQIELDTFFHFFQRVGLAAPAVDLRPAGDASASPYGAACSLQSGCGTARYGPRREDEARRWTSRR